MHSCTSHFYNSLNLSVTAFKGGFLLYIKPINRIAITKLTDEYVGFVVAISPYYLLYPLYIFQASREACLASSQVKRNSLLPAHN